MEQQAPVQDVGRNREVIGKVVIDGLKNLYDQTGVQILQPLRMRVTDEEFFVILYGRIRQNGRDTALNHWLQPLRYHVVHVALLTDAGRPADTKAAIGQCQDLVRGLLLGQKGVALPDGKPAKAAGTTRPAPYAQPAEPLSR
jgi:hypothetical protein